MFRDLHFIEEATMPLQQLLQ